MKGMIGRRKPSQEEEPRRTEVKSRKIWSNSAEWPTIRPSEANRRRGKSGKENDSAE